MASDAQINANRENARRSTGPRTPLGKARASYNAVKHGLTARNAVLPQEDAEVYQALLASLEAAFQPQGPIETFLVERMASAQWRLQRLARIETGFLMAGMDEVKQKEAGKDYYDPYDRHPRPKPKSNLPEDQEITRLLGQLFNLHSGHDGFARITRYENMLNAEYFRALNTLAGLRGPRVKTNPIPPPVAPPRAPEPEPQPSTNAPAAPPVPPYEPLIEPSAPLNSASGQPPATAG